MVEQVAAYFNKLGVTCSIYTYSTLSRSIKVIFDNEFDATSTVGNFEIASSRPQFLAKTSDITASPALVAGKKLKINNVVYAVVEIQYNSLNTIGTVILTESTLDSPPQG